jgi:CelD/BcsL family acetyltransferase involved in cellulose biosynthesis
MSDDYQLRLPSTVDEWMSSLSSRTREKIRSYLRRAQRQQPSFCFRTIVNDAIEEAQLRRVIEFNRARMKAKQRRFGMSELDERNLCRMMHERGLLSIIEIDGEIRAGLLCTLAGNDVTMHVVAHDPAFDDLRLGLLCCVLTVEEAIRRRLRCFHFLWGRYDYKTRLGGERKVLSRVLLLRGPIAVLSQPKLLLSHGFAVLRAWLRRRRHAGQD